MQLGGDLTVAASAVGHLGGGGGKEGRKEGRKAGKTEGGLIECWCLDLGLLTFLACRAWGIAAERLALRIPVRRDRHEDGGIAGAHGWRRHNPVRTLSAAVTC